jgi:hypothetical protein
VLAGELDIATPPRLGRVVAERIPGARFAVLPGAAHQPFQETPAEFNDRVDGFWRRVQARQAPSPTPARRPSPARAPATTSPAISTT